MEMKKQNRHSIPVQIVLCSDLISSTIKYNANRRKAD